MKESFCPDAAILRSSLGAYEDAPGNRYFSLVSELDADARLEGEAGRALDADHPGDHALAFVELDRRDVTARDRRMEGDRSVEDGIQGCSARLTSCTFLALTRSSWLRQWGSQLASPTDRPRFDGVVGMWHANPRHIPNLRPSPNIDQRLQNQPMKRR